jgi:ankyrin repeat protein
MKKTIIVTLVLMVHFLSGCDYNYLTDYLLKPKKSDIAVDLFHAIRTNDIEGVKNIIENKGFDVNGIVGDTYQNQPIHAAAYYGRKNIIAYLLERGANINSECLAGPNTPLQISIWKNHEDLAIFLLEKGADSGINDRGGLSSCEIAVRQKMTRLMKLIPNCSEENLIPSDCSARNAKVAACSTRKTVR